jgi:hypothetical protein
MNNKKITIAVYVIKYGKNIKNIGILYRENNSEKKKF